MGPTVRIEISVIEAVTMTAADPEITTVDDATAAKARTEVAEAPPT